MYFELWLLVDFFEPPSKVLVDDKFCCFCYDIFLVLNHMVVSFYGVVGVMEICVVIIYELIYIGTIYVGYH